MKNLSRALVAIPLVCLLLLAACDDPVMDAARAADFHQGPAIFISEVVRPEDAKRRDLTLRMNYTKTVDQRAVAGLMRTMPGVYQGSRSFEWFRLPEKFQRGSMEKCTRRESLVGGLDQRSCQRSSKFAEVIYKIWPDKGRPPRPYKSKAEAINELRFYLKTYLDLVLFYCGRTPNSCEPLVLPGAPAKAAPKT